MPEQWAPVGQGCYPARAVDNGGSFHTFARKKIAQLLPKNIASTAITQLNGKHLPAIWRIFAGLTIPLYLPWENTQQRSDISWRHQWIPRKMTKGNEGRNSILMTRHFPWELVIVLLTGWSNSFTNERSCPVLLGNDVISIELLRQPIRSTPQIWILTRHTLVWNPRLLNLQGNNWWHHEVPDIFLGLFISWTCPEAGKRRRELSIDRG